MRDELVESLLAQATVGVLSLNIPAVANCSCSDVGVMHSSKIHWYSNPYISRSELLIEPPRFFSDTRFAMTNFGKMILQTVGLGLMCLPNHTPPAPIVHAFN